MFLIRQKYQQFVEYFFYAVLFLLPWQTQYIIEHGYLHGEKWAYNTYSFYAIDGLILLLFVFSWFYKKHVKAVETRHASSLLLIVSYIIISFLSLYWALEQELAFYHFVRLLGAMIFLYLLYKINLDFKKISWSLISAGLIQAMFGIWQFFMQKIWACKWLGMASHDPSILGDQVIENSLGRWLRAYGSLPHPNILAGFLAICLILAIYLFLIENKKSRKIIIGAISTMLLLGLFFTFSRTAFLALFISLLLIFLAVHYFYRQLQEAFLRLLLFLFCIFTILVGIYHPLVASRLSLENRLEQKSVSERAAYIEDSAYLIKNYWPTGVGIGNYTEAVKTQPVHNIYLLIFCETGIFGLLVMIMLIASSFIKIKLNNWPTVFLGAVLLAIVVIGFFDHYLLTLNFGMLLFWLPIGLLNKYE